ncbi:MAG TPA: HAMP domain-containing protein, partial [Ramlibacter sp.]|nr:HAMP domain-containing protein [Ramlibacter sp.]
MNPLGALLPRSLFARVALVIVAGLAIAQLLTYVAIRYERGMALRELMMLGIERDIASSVAIVDRLPAAERPLWLDRLERRNYRFLLGGEGPGGLPVPEDLQRFSEAIVAALRPFEVLRVAASDADGESVRIEVRLGDGNTVVVDARPVGMPVSGWVLWVLLVQLAILATCAWHIVRLVTRPLAELAAAADGLGPDLKGPELDEAGPTEVARAVRAFNAMQKRIARYMADRVEILASISHDLQTPITRLRLRTEMMEQGDEQHRFRRDLEAMQALVTEGVTYARTLHGTLEPALRVDVDALLESLVADYADAGEQVLLEGGLGRPIVTRPHALRRILANLVDNALKFGADVRLHAVHAAGEVTLTVLD